MKTSTLSTIIISFLLTGWMLGVNAQKPHKLSFEEIRQVMEADRTRLQAHLDDEHERFAREHDARLIAETQNAHLTKKLSDIRRVLDRR